MASTDAQIQAGTETARIPVLQRQTHRHADMAGAIDSSEQLHHRAAIRRRHCGLPAIPYGAQEIPNLQRVVVGGWVYCLEAPAVFSLERAQQSLFTGNRPEIVERWMQDARHARHEGRSEEHTSELQSPMYLV